MESLVKYTVYGIYDETEKIVYVGVTKLPLNKRIIAHRTHARRNQPGATMVGYWLLSKPVYTVSPIEENISFEDRLKREKYWIDYYDVINNGMNRPIYKGGANNPWRGGTLNKNGEPTPFKERPSAQGGSNQYAKKVRYIPNGRIFGSVREAADHYGVSLATISRHANGDTTGRRKFEFVGEFKDRPTGKIKKTKD